MKYHFGFKVLAFVLAACALVACFGSLALTISFYQEGLYTKTPEQVREDALYGKMETLAYKVLERYTAIHLGECDASALANAGRDYTDNGLSNWLLLVPGGWDYRIEDLAGKVMESTYSGKVSGDVITHTFSFAVNYPVHATAKEGREILEYTDWEWRDYYVTETEEHYLYYYESPIYHVTIRIQPDAHLYYYGYPVLSQEQANWLYAMRYWAIGVLATSLLVFILCAIYLCCAAGRSHRHEEIRLRGLTRLPLDIYCAAAALACVPLLGFGIDCMENTHYASSLLDQSVFFAAGCGLLFTAALVAGLWLYAVVSQIKMKDGSWWRKSLIGFLLRLLWKGLKYVGRGIRFCFRAVKRLFDLLPLIWQWLVTAAAMVVVPLFCLFLIAISYGFFRFVFVLWFIAACLADIAIVCYGAYAFGLLYKGAKQMAEGDLSTKIPTERLFGAFRDFADRQNSLADAAIETAKAQMKSERMKSELITNVSHDIKTPLTSLINYVDLLEKPHTEEEGKQYLEVLSRQSQKLKKLIDDLMDMSKASSGALHVEITSVDAAEAVNQALGEFADKLEAAGLTPLFRQPEQPVNILADGRLVWRVLSNLLGNIVKYALPGTRVYVDLMQVNNIVRLSIKNISKEELNVSAEDLTERFVRGDASRNTEGSGLGLNIAKSLMELQQGDLQLSVDGDLFKVILTFPSP